MMTMMTMIPGRHKRRARCCDHGTLLHGPIDTQYMSKWSGRCDDYRMRRIDVWCYRNCICMLLPNSLRNSILMCLSDTT